MSPRLVARRERAQKAVEAAKDAGLTRADIYTTFFRALGIGESRETAWHYSTNKPHTYAEWWVPVSAERLNEYMVEAKLSSKLRTKALRCLVEGKELPEKLAAVVARYTEDALLRT